MVSELRVPLGVDPTKPSIARVYDYMLGGRNNFAVDRDAGDKALRITPDAPVAGRANRAFLGRVIRYLVTEVGVRQLLDIGSGLPTQGNVHEIAHSIDPSVRVVYIDNDPMALAHGRALLAGTGTTTVIQADLRQPEEILAHPEIRERIDFTHPVGLLLIGILHHINDHEDPVGITDRLRAALPPGSHLALSHFHNPGDRLPDIAWKARAAEKVFNETLGTGRWRSTEEIMRYFGDMDVLEPGLVPLPDWRPDPGQTHDLQPHTYHTFVGGLARMA